MDAPDWNDYDTNAHMLAMAASIEEKASVTITEIKKANKSDDTVAPMATVANEFPSTRHATNPMLRDCWSVRERLSSQDGVLFMDGRWSSAKICVPGCLMGCTQLIRESAA